MVKIRSYYMNNIQKELSYIGKDFVESELIESINIASVSSIIDLEDIANISNNNLGLISPLQSFSNTELAIGNIVDLTVNINDINEERNSNTTLTQVQPLNLADLIYDPNDVLNGFLEHERHVVRS